jgi:hypothetical protein
VKEKSKRGRDRQVNPRCPGRAPKTVCSLSSTQPNSGGASTIRSAASSGGVVASKRCSTLPKTGQILRSSKGGCIPTDDISRVWAAVEAALDPTNLKPYADEFRHRRGDGEVRWTVGHRLIHFEGVGHERRAVRMVGSAQDITERKRREEERKERAEREHLLMRGQSSCQEHAQRGGRDRAH